MASFLRRLTWARPWKPLAFTNPNFQRLQLDVKVEEERLPDYKASRYYPVRLGEVLKDRYQIVGKLGFGASSTAWLARDLIGRQHVALKLFITAQSMGHQLDNELAMYKLIEATKTMHPGRGSVRKLLDSFDVDGPDGRHRCLVHAPLWDSIRTLLLRNPIHRLPAKIVAVVLYRLFLALDYLHTECHIIHTDIKADNIMLSIEDDSLFSDFEKEELRNPSPRKVVEDARSIYVSRELGMPKTFGNVILCDFGSAVRGDVEHREDVQPAVYRAPEVILEAPWSYQIDIWNTACMVWDIFEDGHLFTGWDSEDQRYRGRAHLAEMTALLGQPPLELLRKGTSSHKFFTDQGALQTGLVLPPTISLKEREISLQGEEQERFLAFMQSMLQWDPLKRASTRELAKNDWLGRYL